MDHLYNGESHYRVFHDPINRTVQLIDFSGTPEMEVGKMVTKISEAALIELMLNYDKWGGTPGEWWDKLIKAMELMGKLNEETSDKTGMLNSKVGS